MIIQVHQKFVELDTAIETISSLPVAGSQAAPHAAPSATAKLSQNPRSAVAARVRADIMEDWERQNTVEWDAPTKEA